MKFVYSLVIAAIGLINCTSTPPTMPVGYQPCSKDQDCARGQYCGFVQINSYAVCRD